MAALQGKEDDLLEPIRFARLLRQANDAEIADVRKLDDGTFEVSPHKSDLALSRAYVPAADRPEAVTPTNGAAADAPQATGELSARLPALRFRRGSRAPLRTSDIPMIGMVRVEEDAEIPSAPALPDAAAPSPKKPSRRKGVPRKPKAEVPAAVLEPVAEVLSVPAAAPKRRRRGRGTKSD
jgi:hypothetical protein